MFMLDFPPAAGKKPAMIDKARIDMLVEKNQMKLMSEDIYKRICDNIDPVTGETREHHADGTRKTEVEQVLHQLNEERSNKSDRSEATINEPEHGRSVEPIDDSYGSEVAGVVDEATAHSMTRSRPKARQQEAEFSQDDIFGDMFGGNASAEPASQFGFSQQPDMPQGIQRAEEPAGMSVSQDHNGKQSLKTSPQKRRIAVMGAVALTLCGSAICFLATSSIIQATGTRVADIPIVGRFMTDPNDRRDLPLNEQVRSGETQAVTETTTGMEVVTRGDFDPEEAVVHFALADDASQDVATKFFQAVRIAYSEGNLSQLNSMIAYDAIHGQIANAYAVAEQQRLGLTDEAKNALATQYVAILNQREGEHIANRDLDASIYCGRIREIRVDDTDANKMYIVTESLSGDHQRACFVLQGDGTGMYALTGMVSPDGYVKMIREGTI